jgi:hypothetical protein
MSKSNYVIVNKDTVPVWIEEEVPAKAKIFYVSKENTVEQTFENIQKESIE